MATKSKKSSKTGRIAQGEYSIYPVISRTTGAKIGFRVVKKGKVLHYFKNLEESKKFISKRNSK
jgi:hypothetical protein